MGKLREIENKLESYCLMSIEFLRKSKLRFLDSAFWEDLAFTYEMVTRVTKAVLLSKITYHYLCRPGSLSHYQDREQLEKSEIMKNVLNIYLEKCQNYLDLLLLVEKIFLFNAEKI